MLRVGCWAIGRVSGMSAGRFWMLAGRASRAGVVRAARSFLARRATGPGRITAGRMSLIFAAHFFLGQPMYSTPQSVVTLFSLCVLGPGRDASTQVETCSLSNHP